MFNLQRSLSKPRFPYLRNNSTGHDNECYIACTVTTVSIFSSRFYFDVFFLFPPDIFLICFSYLRVSRCDTFSIVLVTNARNNSMRQFHSEISIVLCCRSFINCRLESIISWLTGKRTSYDAARTKGATQTARATTESNRETTREKERKRKRIVEMKKHSSLADTMSVVYPTSRCDTRF